MSTWLVATVSFLGALILSYWALPEVLFDGVDKQSAAVRGLTHFVVFGVAVTAGEIVPSCALMYALDSINVATLWQQLTASLSVNVIVWGGAGFAVGPWLEAKRYALKIEEAFGFALGGVLVARLAHVMQIIVAGPLAGQPTVFELLKINTAYFGLNFLVLTSAFALHRAGVRRLYG